jgi:hypothetical protein
LLTYYTTFVRNFSGNIVPVTIRNIIRTRNNVSISVREFSVTKYVEYVVIISVPVKITLTFPFTPQWLVFNSTALKNKCIAPVGFMVYF